MDHQGWAEYYQTLRGLKAQAEAALEAGDTVAASRLAQELLARNTVKTWNYGNEIHAANQILGLAALQEGHIELAKAYLQAAGRTPGSPQLNSFGPTMTLAQALLRRGEGEAVSEYLDLVARFWATPTPFGNILLNALDRHSVVRHRRTLLRWRAAIRRGEVPTLNRVAHAEKCDRDN